MNREVTIWKTLGCSALLVPILSSCGGHASQGPVQSEGATSIVSIIPAPREIANSDGQFNITAGTQVSFAAGSGSEQVAHYFTDLLQRTRGLELSTAPAGDAAGDDVISFELTAGESASADEGYSLTVSPQRIVVSSRSSRGLFYGAVTLWQLMTSDMSSGAAVTLPALSIADAPRFPWRGLMLDSARHYQSPEVIKQFIDVMALHKLNVFHWHLTDDQAWRLEIRKYPKLTSVGAWRVPAGPAAAADIDPATGQPRLYGGFYSQDVVREIVAYAAARHITVVPEIEMPGHATAAIVAYPQLGVTDDPPRQVPADWGVYRHLFNVEDSTFAFLEDVLRETMELFPGEYIHIGGDEAAKDQWEASSRIQARMRELGVEDEHALQSYFVQRIEKFLNRHGRRLIGWDEILEGGLAPNATVMSWRGLEGAVTAAAAGHDAVLAPAPTLYFDHRPLDTASPPGRGKVMSLQAVYQFDPAPPAMTEEQRKHILGLQANLWTEHIRTDERLEYMTYPRAAALAEVAWSAPAQINWAGFSERLPAQLARYRKLGVTYATPGEDAPEAPGRRRTSHELEMCSDKIVLSLEDDAPVRGDRAIFLVDIMNPCWIFKGADLSGIDAIAANVGQVPFNFQIGEDVNEIPLRKPATPAGELEIRLDNCEGARIAALPLQPAAANHAVTQLAPAASESRSGRHDLCLTFTQSSVDPTWVIDSVELIPARDASARN